MQKIVLSLFAFALTSCTSLSKEDCQTINWFDRGKSDAIKGEASEVFSKYQKTCHEHGVKVTKARKPYFKGRKEGLKIFCTPDQGQRFGRNGYSYYGICPKELEANFLMGYRLGKKEYEIEKRERELEEEKEEFERRQKELAEEAEEEERRKREEEEEENRRRSEECSFDSDCPSGLSCSFGRCE